MEAKRGSLHLTLIVSMFLLWGCSSENIRTEIIELSYTNHFPPTHIQSQLAEAWCKEVEKRTGGRVKITYYPVQTLLEADKIYNGILNGITDIGQSVFGYNRGVFPAMEAFSLPHGFKSAPEATRVLNEFHKHFKLKETSRIKILYLHAHGPAMLHSKKKIEKLEEMRGVKVRSYGFNAAMVKALGGIPVSMPMSEVYEALSKGVVDATFSPIEALKGWKQAEVVDYSIEIEGVAYSTAMYAAINRHKWNSLPQDIKETIEEINQEWRVKTGEAWESSDEEGREYTLAQCNEIIELGKEESDRWAEAVSTVITDYVDNTKEKGLPGQDYVDFIRASLKKD
ncbi:MAG: TRAP transporter substrate-binding protein [Deltaproteobacteria bacterium]|nr:TRAP transporter substrate-binding protein [Deltaproteobacteria bacterium]